MGCEPFGAFLPAPKKSFGEDREPTAIDKYTSGESDSTVGDRAKSVNTYRESLGTTRVHGESAARGAAG